MLVCGWDLGQQVASKGQALVETVIITPILVFLLIGVFEVGWILRNYLVLANANREAARFAIRPGYVDYDAAQPDYTPIITHMLISLSRQLDFTPTGVVIISRIYVDTDYVCDPADIFDPASPNYFNCDCEMAIVQPYTPTIAISPLDVMTYTYTWPETSTRITKLDYAKILSEAILYNRRHNCELMNRSKEKSEVDNIVRPNYIPQIEDQITVEFFWLHYQLFGFPIWNNPLLNPVELYGHSTFRRVVSR